MAENQLDTEEQIFEAASRVFQDKGYAGGRMQEIADEADINKSMLHYYFRSKDKLFEKVYQRELRRFFPVVFRVMGSDIPLDEKISQLVDSYYSFLNDNPRMAAFLISEMNRNPQQFREFIKDADIHLPDTLFHQITQGQKEGRIADMAPKQLMVSIVGLTLFPFIATTMIKAIFDFDEQEFLQFLQNRKSFLVDFILNAINYKPS